jgi:dynein intermediate chain 1, axonemal
MFNVENAVMAGANEQEDLTQEQKDEVILKTLTTKNPQAPSNITTFSYAERRFMKEDSVPQIVFHYEVDGDIIMKDTDAANQQDDDAEMKKKNETDMLYAINASIIQQFGKAPLSEDINAQRKSLRNQFNYQERAA